VDRGDLENHEDHIGQDDMLHIEVRIHDQNHIDEVPIILRENHEILREMYKKTPHGVFFMNVFLDYREIGLVARVIDPPRHHIHLEPSFYYH
jgi:hypothetical protein